jgi:putative hemolysin
MHDHPQPLTAEQSLIDIHGHVRPIWLRQFRALICQPFERLLAIDRLNATYADLLDSQPDSAPFGQLLKQLDITYRLTSDDLAKIPSHGPLVVVANHPFGGIEGIALGDLMQRVRPDTKILGNYLLERVEPIRDSLISVDPFGRRSSVSANAGTFRTCLRWLKAGNCLVTFPSGEVAHYCRQARRIVDPSWSPHIASLVRMSGAQVLPVYIPGRNSVLFNLMGQIHPRLRTLMLGRELMARRSSQIKLLVGRSIPAGRMKPYESDAELIRWLRFNTYFQANRTRPPQHPVIQPIRRLRRTRSPQSLIAPVPNALQAAEIANLPADQKLIGHKQMAVYVAESRQIPQLMREIGRLREKTFREVGEGTGKSMDVDLFDSYYHHLILWNDARREVVGAYRMGHTRTILERYGRKGLYTHSLFHFKSGLLRQLDSAMELGRSFIRSTYQRQPNCLALLWKGIGAYIVRHPEYRILFGPVSISNSYHRVSKHIMIQFLQRCCTIQEPAAYARPRHPLRPLADRRLPEGAAGMTPESIDDVSLLVSEIEDDGKRVPVLIKHYLKLNGQFIAFNVDRDFADAIDGLVVVDLMQTDAKLLQRFMGKEGADFYREQWGSERRKVENQG